MKHLEIIYFIIYTTTLLSLIWARLKLFDVCPKPSKPTGWIYDPVVCLQALSTYYYLLLERVIHHLQLFSAMVLLVLGLIVFWWSVSIAGRLDFAFSDNVSKLVTEGPYSLVRHPFYFAYSLIWLSPALLFNNPILWITLGYLMTFYFISARKEERVMRDSKYSREYGEYSQKVGMFLPRIIIWKS